MSGVGDFLDWPDADVPFLTRDEERRVAEYPLPGDKARTNESWGGRALYYPRKSLENPGRWFADHAERLAALERAEGLR